MRSTLVKPIRRHLLGLLASSLYLPLLGKVAAAASATLMVSASDELVQTALKKEVDPSFRRLAAAEVLSDRSLSMNMADRYLGTETFHSWADVICARDFEMKQLAGFGEFNELNSKDIPRLAASVRHEVGARKALIMRSPIAIMSTPAAPRTPTSLADLWDRPVAKRLGIVTSDIIDAALIASAAHGGARGRVSHADAGFRAWRDLGVHVYETPDAAMSAMRTGEIAVMFGPLTRYFALKKLGLSLQKNVPDEGTYYLNVEAAVPAHSRNRSSAQKYIDAVLSRQAQQSIAETFGMAPVVSDVELNSDLSSQIELVGHEAENLWDLNAPEILQSLPDIRKLWALHLKS
ncbi:extracellular solute-binding protein [Rhizobium lusitanum]|uniref:ABC-type Fe3+ transport system, substrate-binding protein n=1 Tax=Rhizobium lusitanum TaxID=293958 RepID=A0A1C3WDN7_9HYPH|nr:extracellular solute-binding protein [Rhizobium lusitanum]SCB38140.1 ABC-type Fe3+ transport system, substrate-binding protein [Rhizobium lusitanum]